MNITHSFASARRCLVVFLAVVCSACGGSSDGGSAPLDFVQSFEGGTHYRTKGEGGAGRFDVVVLRGEWREMGRQYGGLLGSQMAEFYRLAVDDYLAREKLPYEEIRALGELSYSFEPPDQQALIEGMSETSGLSLEHQKIVSALMGILFEAGCSSMDAWGRYTGGGSLVVGRNWDTGKVIFRKFSQFLTVAVYNPSTGEYGVADINYAGSISFQSGMNSRGLFVDLQNGEVSDPTYHEVSPGAFNLFSFLLRYGRVAELPDAFKSTPANIGLIINTADSETASVFEWSPAAGVRERSGAGLVASSNHFIDPTWPSTIKTGNDIPPGAAGAFSRERLDNLLMQGEAAKGRLDALQMMQIFDLQIDEGGPSFPELTMYHIVALPAHLTLWLKAPTFSGWEKIDLRPLFLDAADRGI